MACSIVNRSFWVALDLTHWKAICKRKNLLLAFRWRELGLGGRGGRVPIHLRDGRCSEGVGVSEILLRAPGGCWVWVSVLGELPVTKLASTCWACSVTFISFPIYVFNHHQFLCVCDVGQWQSTCNLSQVDWWGCSTPCSEQNKVTPEYLWQLLFFFINLISCLYWSRVGLPWWLRG